MKKIVIVIFALVFCLTGCGSNTSNTSTKETSGTQIFTYATALSPINDWDPAIAYDEETKIFVNTYESLLRNMDDGSFKPVLATSYSKSKDNLVWTFKLRKGVKFHDGTDCNAEAVKFSIERNKKCQKGASYIWDPLKEVKVIDDYTVEFILSTPAPVEEMVSCAYCAWIYSPTAVGNDIEAGTEWFSKGNEAGTGPYMMQSNEGGKEIVLTRFDGYWGGWEGDHMDKLVFKQVAENASRRQLIESGEVDVTNKMDTEDLKALKKETDKVEVRVNDSYQNLSLFMNTQKPLLKNITIRKALAYTYPYKKLVDDLKNGEYASIATATIISSNMWGASTSIPYTYDLKKAKELLSEAGYPNGGFDLTVTYNGSYEDRKKALELWKGELAKVGITLNIQALTYDGQMGMFHNTSVSKQQDILCYGWWPDLINPMSFFGPFIKSNGEFNFTYYKSKKMDAALDAAFTMSGSNQKKAAEMFQAISEQLNDECIAITICDEKNVIVINPKIKGYKSNINYPEAIFCYEITREK